MAKVRDALRNLVAIVIDERDQKELADREEEVDEIQQEVVAERVQISSRVGLFSVMKLKRPKLTKSLLGSLAHSRQLPRRGSKGTSMKECLQMAWALKGFLGGHFVPRSKRWWK